MAPFRSHRVAKAGLTALLGAVLLSGCAITARPAPTAQPTIQPTVQATNLPATVAPPTIAPGTAVPATPTLLPTLPPATAIPPTTRPALAPLLGPEWRVLGQGDLYGTGVETVVAYLPSSVVATPRLQPPYVGYGVAAEQIVVVQRNPQGQPWVRLQISLNGLFFNGDNRTATTFPGVPDSRTSAFAIAMEHQSAPVRVVPIDRQGNAVAQGFAARWANGGMVVETLILPGQPNPNPIPPEPLLGPEWTIVAQGDLFGLGAETVVATRPAGMPVGPIQLLPGYDGFTQVVGQFVVVQRNAQGKPWVRLLVAPGTIQLNGDDRNPVVVPGGPNARTVAFALAVDGAGGPYRFVPLGADGRPVEAGFATSYTAATGGFTFSPLLIGQPVPQPGTLSGRVGYPSSGNPVLDVFAIDADDPSRFYVQQLTMNQPFWSLRVAPGRYYLVAYTAEPGTFTIAGAYTEYVRCGMLAGCQDHSLIAVTVGENQSVPDINIGDWYAPEGSFPARPQGTPQPPL